MMARTSSAVAARSAAGGITIRDLLSYRLHLVANAISRSAAVRYREFDVNLGEWRAIALLAADQPSSLNELARAAALDKAQMSRVVSGLIARGFVLREPTAACGRSVRLTLTRRGEALYAKLIAAADERNRAFLACLTPDELAALDSALAKLKSLANALAHGKPVAGERLRSERLRDRVDIINTRR
jgi:DNA-binding MarR family transcriptional regulator